MRSGSRLVSLMLACVLALSAGTSFAATAAPAADAVPQQAPDQAQLERADRLIAAYRFDAIYRTVHRETREMSGLAKGDAEPTSLWNEIGAESPGDVSEDLRESTPGEGDLDAEDRALVLRVFDLLSWDVFSAHLRDAISREYSESQLTEILAFYESDPGRALVDCVARADSIVMQSFCRDELSDAHKEVFLEFEKSPIMLAMMHSDARILERAMLGAVAQVLRHAPELSAALSELCGRRPKVSLCPMLYPTTPCETRTP